MKQFAKLLLFSFVLLISTTFSARDLPNYPTDDGIEQTTSIVKTEVQSIDVATINYNFVAKEYSTNLISKLIFNPFIEDVYPDKNDISFNNKCYKAIFPINQYIIPTINTKALKLFLYTNGYISPYPKEVYTPERKE